MTRNQIYATLAITLAVLAGLLIPAHGLWKVPSLDDYAPTPPTISHHR
jgi:hypothetical protein